MSERRRDGKVKGEKWKVESEGGGLTRWGIDRISPLPERFLTGVIFIFVGTFPKVPFVSAVRRGNEHSRTPKRLSAKYAITKRCPPIRCLHNRIELHLACLVLFYDIKVIVFSEKCKCVFLPCILATFRLNILFSQAHIEYILTGYLSRH